MSIRQHRAADMIPVSRANEMNLNNWLQRRRKLSNKMISKTDPSQPTIYRIRIKGQLDSQWTDWFEGLTITPEENGDTLISGPVNDQAALHGLLKKIRDLGIPLVSVCPGQPEGVRSSGSKPNQKLKG